MADLDEVYACAGCGSWLREVLFDMGEQPLAEGGSEGVYPLKLMKCENCDLVQLSHIVDPKKVFAKGHLYSSGNTKALRKHFADLADKLPLDVYGNMTIVDIGANDGTLLNAVHGRYKRIAVEPTDQINKCAPDVIKFQDYWSHGLAYRILASEGKADIITATNVLAHVPDPYDFLSGVAALLTLNDGVFITENHDFSSISQGMQFDTIYHEHLRYYTPATLAFILNRAGFSIESIESIDTHGGSFRTTARYSTKKFPNNVEKAAAALGRKLAQCSGKIYGIGATTRATPLIHYTGIARRIDRICEVAGSDKIGTKLPGTDINVVDEAELLDNQPKYALILSWHIADDIMASLRAKGYRGKFIIPLPEPRIIDG